MSAALPPLFGRQKLARLIAFAVIVLLFAGLYFGGVTSVLPPCAFKSATGLPCPLCGGTRAAQALVQGDPSRALYLNFLAFPSVLMLGVAGLICLVESLRGRALADWPALGRRLSFLTPAALFLILLWWIPHIYQALRTPKEELLDLRSPVARAAYQRLAPKN